MRRRHGAATSAVLAAVLALAPACTTLRAYDGPALPAGRVAVIEKCALQATYVLVTLHACVESVDGRPVRLGTGDVAVLPGNHEVTVALFNTFLVVPWWSTPATLRFTAEPGHAYEVGGEGRGSLFTAAYYRAAPHIWITDEATGRVVAGDGK